MSEFGMSPVGNLFAVIFVFLTSILAGAMLRNSIIADNCDNYGESRIDGTWYECREIKSPLANGKQEG